MYAELGQAYGSYEQDPQLRCAVLYAHGDHFTGGIELPQWAPFFRDGRMPPLPAGAIDPLMREQSLGKPLVIAVQGWCLTIGLELLLAADIRVAADSTRFAQIEIKRGIYPIGGATVRLVQELGWGNAMRILLTGDEFGSEQAYRLGLVQEVAPAGEQLERAIAIAATIARQSPVGVRATLASARLARQDGERAAFARMLIDLQAAMATDDAVEGLNAFLERREPRFKSRLSAVESLTGELRTMSYAWLAPIAVPARSGARSLSSTLALLDAATVASIFPRQQVATAPVQAMGLEFPNPVGLAAGLDKNGAHIDALSLLGFGFIEVGTVTPRPQPGNPRPRLFRVPQARAVINRMGFNNLGVDRLVRNVRAARYRGILGINIGKNSDTPIERAATDYLVCLRKVYPVASYVTINISSPNTKNLRQLQHTDELDGLLRQLKAEQARLAEEHGRYVPLALKIAPDLGDEQVRDMSELLLAHRIDAVIATNTTVSRDGVEGLPNGQESGGLSGAPLGARAALVVQRLAEQLQGRLAIIAAGGIMSGADAASRIASGASLVQLYTGLVYAGPRLVAEAAAALASQPAAQSQGAAATANADAVRQ